MMISRPTPLRRSIVAALETFSENRLCFHTAESGHSLYGSKGFTDGGRLNLYKFRSTYDGGARGKDITGLCTLGLR